MYFVVIIISNITNEYCDIVVSSKKI